MKRRGAARVLGIDSDDGYLAQARFAAEVSGLDIELRQLSVYDVGALGERFDVVLFLGVLYHLRHPLLALDLIHEHVASDLPRLPVHAARRRDGRRCRRTTTSGTWRSSTVPAGPSCTSSSSATPHDPTNWWVPNRACAEAMLRSSGFAITEPSGARSLYLPARRRARRRGGRLPAPGTPRP